MDKQDAIDFIIQEFEDGRSPSEISQMLSEQLGAPVEVVSRFVSRTLDQRLSFLEASTPEPASPTPSMKSDPVAPAAWEALDDPEVPASPAIDYEIPASRWEVQPPANPPAATTAATTKPPAPEPIDPRLEKFILDALAKDRKESDVIMSVCERAGIDWPEAQRMVSRVSATHHKKIVSRRNRFIIPICLGAIAIGLGLAYAGIQEMMRLAPLVNAINQAGIEGAMQALPSDFMRSSFWALGLGAALIIGGSIGLVRAIRAGIE